MNKPPLSQVIDSMAQLTVRLVARLVAGQQLLTYRVAEIMGQHVGVADPELSEHRLVHVGVVMPPCTRT